MGQISIHAAREGGDGFASAARAPPQVFQSTPPVKAATAGWKALGYSVKFQSTPPVKAATFQFFAFAPRRDISIHAAREGGDCCEDTLNAWCKNFNPRRP